MRRLSASAVFSLAATVALLFAVGCSSGETLSTDQTATPGAQTATSVTPSATPGAATATPVATSTPGPPNTGVIPVPPERDIYDLGRRLKLHTSSPIERQASPLPPALNEGDTVTWTVNRDSGNATVNARVWLVTENAYWIFEESYPPDEAQLAAAAEEFESTIWPAVTGALGNIATPGVDGDPRMVIFHGKMRSGVAGYFNSGDEYPVAINPNSNEREVIYISADNLQLGSRNYLATLAHELQHAIHWATDPGEESWVNEGISEVAAGLAGFSPGSVQSFLQNPNTSLLEWAPDVFLASPNYGAAALFFEYLSAHYGGTETLRAIIENEADSIASVDAVLQELGFDETTVDVFTDWVVANYVDDESGPYSHPDRVALLPKSSDISEGQEVEDSVRPFGTNYYVVDADAGQLEITFEGAPEGRVFPAEPHSGDTCWWGNAGDSINSTLTREVDLTGLASATFSYQVWYSIEEGWDYAYVTVSTDDGVTWTALPTEHTSDENPNGTAIGPGLTGQSGDWVEDSVDLSPFAGSKILLRLEYVTDDAIHDRGACFDDFSIPELGWTDDTGSDGDWAAEGFVRLNDRRPVKYAVQVIRDTSGGPAEVEMLPVSSDGTGSIAIEGAGIEEELVIAVSAVTPDISGDLDYTLGVSSQ